MKRWMICTSLLIVLVLFFVQVVKSDSDPVYPASSSNAGCGAELACPNATYPFTLTGTSAIQPIINRGAFNPANDPSRLAGASLTTAVQVSNPLLAWAPSFPGGAFSDDAGNSASDVQPVCGATASIGYFACYGSAAAGLSPMSNGPASTWAWTLDPGSPNSLDGDTGTQYGSGFGVTRRRWIPVDQFPGQESLFPAPEPSSLALFGSGLLVICFSFRKLSKSKSSSRGKGQLHPS